MLPRHATALARADCSHQPSAWSPAPVSAWRPSTAASANPAGTGLVINEVYGGGGNAGATVQRNDFVELYNPTRPADLAGGHVGRSTARRRARARRRPRYAADRHGAGAASTTSVQCQRRRRQRRGPTPLPTPDATGTDRRGQAARRRQVARWSTGTTVRRHRHDAATIAGATRARRSTMARAAAPRSTSLRDGTAAAARRPDATDARAEPAHRRPARRHRRQRRRLHADGAGTPTHRDATTPSADSADRPHVHAAPIAEIQGTGDDHAAWSARQRHHPGRRHRVVPDAVASTASTSRPPAPTPTRPDASDAIFVYGGSGGSDRPRPSATPSRSTGTVAEFFGLTQITPAHRRGHRTVAAPGRAADQPPAPTAPWAPARRTELARPVRRTRASCFAPTGDFTVTNTFSRPTQRLRRDRPGRRRPSR